MMSQTFRVSIECEQPDMVRLSADVTTVDANTAKQVFEYLRELLQEKARGEAALPVAYTVTTEAQL